MRQLLAIVRFQVRRFYGINGSLSSSDGDKDFAAEEVRRRFRRVEANDLQEVEQCLDDLVPVLASTPEIIHINPNASSWSPAHWQDSARLIRSKIRNVRYSLSTVPSTLPIRWEPLSCGCPKLLAEI